MTVLVQRQFHFFLLMVKQIKIIWGPLKGSGHPGPVPAVSDGEFGPGFSCPKRSFAQLSHEAGTGWSTFYV